MDARATEPASAIVSEAPTPIAFISGDRLAFANRAWRELLGDVSVSEGTLAAAVERCASTQAIQELPPVAIASGPSTRWAGITLVPCRSSAGGLLGVAAYALDTTAQIAARDLLERSHHERDRFLNLLAHELRGPMAPILTAIDLYRMDKSGRSVPRALDIIERQSRWLLQRLDNLLDVSRAARGRLSLSPTRVDLTDRVRAGVEMARSKIEQRQHRLTLDASEPVFVNADGKRLALVFGNLVDNAALYTEAGGAIQVSCTRNASRAIVRVRDSGRGLRSEELESIFEPFVQGSDVSGGLGLGLAFVKQIVERSGGRVTASSAGPGTGSEFVVELPLV
jgi:signal transduction histidine kinase